MKEIWTTMASVMGVWAFCQSLLHSIFPPEVRLATLKLLGRLFNYFSAYCYFDIVEIDGVNTNELYNAVQLYLSSYASTSANRLSLTRALNSSNVTFGLSTTDRITDVFKNVTCEWDHVVTQRQSQTFSWRPVPEEKRGFTLRVRKTDKDIILDSYLEHITREATNIRRNNQDRYLYTNSKGGSMDARGHPWESVSFKHPSTFDTLAMDPVKKTEIMADLMDFSNGSDFYERTGRAWKRGYLLYGPPGTGKSSMIAAMANYLGYDIYDLELCEVSSNSELRKLLMKTSSKSIIVIEDIDCSISFTNRKDNHKPSPTVDKNTPETEFGLSDDNKNNSITLSGLLNFTDGLWSCCGSERIFIFTTNHVEKLDPALLRSGRMDMHIHMSYCSFASLKILFKNYLEVDLDEDVLKEFEAVIDKAEMTPADVSEALIKNRRDKNKAVNELLETLKAKADKLTTKNAIASKVSGEDVEQEKRALEDGQEFPEMNGEKHKLH